MGILLGMGCMEAIYGLIGLKGLMSPHPAKLWPISLPTDLPLTSKLDDPDLHPYKHFSKVSFITPPANLATKLAKNRFSGKHCTVKILP